MDLLLGTCGKVFFSLLKKQKANKLTKTKKLTLCHASLNISLLLI